MIITKEIKEEFLSIDKPEQYMDFQAKYPDLRWNQYDEEMMRKLTEIIRMAPGSCGNGSGYHEELWKRE